MEYMYILDFMAILILKKKMIWWFALNINVNENKNSIYDLQLQ